MKVVILCGGKGTRMKEVTEDIPKPLAPIGGKPILWHIMKTYMYYGYNEFILLLGYKGEKIKEYFMDYHWKNQDFILSGEDNKIQLLGQMPKWKIQFINTGDDTMTGGRIKKIEDYIDEENFMLTYGDGLADININRLVEFHKTNNKIATVTGIKKENQYGTLTVENNIAKSFSEKPQGEDIINGGFFVLNKKIFSYLDNSDKCIFEREPLVNLVKDRELSVYEHTGFWKAMDTYKDLEEVNKMWDTLTPPWKVW